MSANNKTWRMAASTNDVTLIGVMQGINGHVKRVRLIAGRHALGTVEVEEGRAAMTLTHAYEEMTPESVRKTRIWTELACALKRWIMAVNIPIQCPKLSN